MNVEASEIMSEITAKIYNFILDNRSEPKCIILHPKLYKKVSALCVFNLKETETKEPSTIHGIRVFTSYDVTIESDIHIY